MKPYGMSEEAYERYQSDGFTEDEIVKIWHDTLYFKNKLLDKNEPRKITSSTYERAQKALNRKVKAWLGMKNENNKI